MQHVLAESLFKYQDSVLNTFLVLESLKAQSWRSLFFTSHRGKNFPYLKYGLLGSSQVQYIYFCNPDLHCEMVFGSCFKAHITCLNRTCAKELLFIPKSNPSYTTFFLWIPPRMMLAQRNRWNNLYIYYYYYHYLAILHGHVCHELDNKWRLYFRLCL